MNATHQSPMKLVKQSVGWNNAKEQICNQCTSRLSWYLWLTYESGGIFPTSSAVGRSRFLAGVAIANISMQLVLLYSELGYTFTWPRPTVEPVCFGCVCINSSTCSCYIWSISVWSLFCILYLTCPPLIHHLSIRVLYKGRTHAICHQTHSGTYSGA